MILRHSELEGTVGSLDSVPSFHLRALDMLTSLPNIRNTARNRKDIFWDE